MLGRFVPLACPPCQLAEYELGGGVARIDLKLLLKLGARIVDRASLSGLGKQNLAQPVVNARRAGVVLENGFVGAGGFVASAARFKSLRFEHSGLGRRRRFSGELLSWPPGEVEKVVHGDGQDLGVVWEVAFELQ